jgi:hypothetical protein
MKILRQNQYNQSIGKYKLLSSTSGVGSIITSKLGYYVLISDINKWKFLHWVNAKTASIRTNNSDDNVVYKNSEIEILNRGLNFIDDKRFVKFLKREKELDNLICLVGIPHMTLNEGFNTPNWKNHPIKLALERSGDNGSSSDFMIKATHFPKWFKNKHGDLKRIDSWLEIWEKECRKHSGSLKLDQFAPPRDGNDFLRELNSKNEDGTPIKIREYRTLEQTNLILICPNGHLSDIPWQKYLRWKTEKDLRIRNDEDKGENLLTIDNCCSNPRLKWTESKTKSEGYASVFIHCESCGLGNGVSKESPKINLEGINSLQPFCRGEKSWEIDLENDRPIPFELCHVRGDASNGRETMKVALVTANNVYYASGFSSLFIPMHLAENKTQLLISAIEKLEEKYKNFKTKAISKETFWNKLDKEFWILENDFQISDNDNGMFLKQVETEFLNPFHNNDNIDFHEHYRWQEYQCFSNNSTIPDESKNKGLKFKDIKAHADLMNFFIKIQQVEELKVTNVQLDFTRVKPKERVIVNGEPIDSTTGQDIFSVDPNELYVLPANETLGEGLFFQFNERQIGKWISGNQENLRSRFSKFLSVEPNLTSQGAAIKRRIYNNGIKHFLIHSFSHMLMRELEFSCGYPTASLKERLYISNNPEKMMSGVLIYTAEGAEGSMGGIVSQGEPQKLFDIIKKGLHRAVDCSSDPLCWESEGQGIFDLNLAACFSCSLVSETACEEMNLGLDRRILVDEKFGFFLDLLSY